MNKVGRLYGKIIFSIMKKEIHQFKITKKIKILKSKEEIDL